MGRGEHQVGDETNATTFRRILNFDSPQYLLLAGRDSDGRLVSNELTELFAECIVPEFKNPVIVVRYVKDTHEPPGRRDDLSPRVLPQGLQGHADRGDA